MKDIKCIKSLAVGDYQIVLDKDWQCGQFSTADYINPMEIYRYAKAVAPYTSSNENNFCVVLLRNCNLESFAWRYFILSSKDANVNKVENGEQDLFILYKKQAIIALRRK